jgi:spore germination protein
MNNRLQKMLRNYLIILLLVFLTACAEPKISLHPEHVSAWLVYWEIEAGLMELEAYGSLLDKVSLFAFELDERGSPQYAPDLVELFPRFFSLAETHGFKPWITVVNDMRKNNGTVLLKETNLLRPILSNPTSRKNHALALATAVAEGNFAGLDLDYEGFDSSDQDSLNSLFSDLSQELRCRGLGFNVIVEPRRALLPLPETVGITIMGYNLHGPHSEAGPRATPQFVAKLGIRNGKGSTSNPTIALATGGFAWSPTGSVRKMNWITAQSALKDTLRTGRDPRTDVPYGDLKDGTKFWYEDAQSIQTKWGAARGVGFNSLILWHLGGNDGELFEWLSESRKKK